MAEGAARDRPADGLITLYEAAEQLGVHYMTVYRYVRTGRLPGRKVGVEWRVEPDDLATFMAESTEPASPRRRIDYGRRLVDRLVVGDERGAWNIVQAALTAGLDPDDVYLQVLAPALATIGERWAKGLVTVGQEHQASVVVLRLIGRLGPLFTRRGRTRGTVVL
ncbi:MAG: B12-binding domain-containing protein, partial [Acidimicrobiales bacterium]